MSDLSITNIANDLSLRESTNVWYEKYRPKTVDDVILPPILKDQIKNYLKDGGYNMPHLGLFSRTPGTGKSSLAKAILNDLTAESLFINASLDKGIDILRTRIQRFAATAPLRNTVKIVVLDEFDNFSRDGQNAFRNFIDEFGKNVRFILTGNYKENIIEPLLDRLEIYDFNQFNAQDIAQPILDRLIYILENEKVEYDKKDVIAIMRQDFPRIRKMIGTLNQCTHNNKLDFTFSNEFTHLEELGKMVKEKNFEKALKIVYSMGSVDHLYGYYGNNLDIIVKEPNNKINAIIILAKYQTSSVTAKDKQLNAAACICELLKL